MTLIAKIVEGKRTDNPKEEQERLQADNANDENAIEE